jgi:tryptophanyl-tRNA synthetase
METFVAPIRERIKEVESDTALLSRIAKQGCEKARESAQKTIKEVREIIGFRSF